MAYTDDMNITTHQQWIKAFEARTAKLGEPMKGVMARAWLKEGLPVEQVYVLMNGHYPPEMLEAVQAEEIGQVLPVIKG